MCQVESRHAYRGLLRREFVLGATLLAAVLLNSEQIKAQQAKLTAEQLLDAICAVTGQAEEYPGMPAGTLAIDLVDPPEGHKFLQVFGQPQRELPCECERSTDSNLSQALQLINGPTVHNKLRADAGNVHRWITEGKSDADIINLLYQSALSRPALPQEQETAAAHIKASEDRTRALEDVAWAVINSKEFLFQH